MIYLGGWTANLDRSQVSNNTAQVCLVVAAALLVFEDSKLGVEEDSPAAYWLSGLVVRMLFTLVGFVSPLLVNVVTVVDVFGIGGKISPATRNHPLYLLFLKNIKNVDGIDYI